MRAALTVWEARISPVFDVSREAVVLDLEGGALRGRASVSIDTPNPARKVERLLQLGVQTLICGAISAPLQRDLQAQGIQVLGFVAGAVEQVVRAFVAGELPQPALTMPGCGQQRRRRGRRRVGSGRGGGRSGGRGRGDEQSRR